jgi:hypothetical protein
MPARRPCFGSLKVERLHGMEFKNHREAKDATLQWLLWYNGSRMHSTFDYLSPAQFEQKAQASPLAPSQHDREGSTATLTNVQNQYAYERRFLRARSLSPSIRCAFRRAFAARLAAGRAQLREEHSAGL